MELIAAQRMNASEMAVAFVVAGQPTMRDQPGEAAFRSLATVAVLPRAPISLKAQDGEGMGRDLIAE
jgi:hypothetical protein